MNPQENTILNYNSNKIQSFISSSPENKFPVQRNQHIDNDMFLPMYK